MSDICCDRTTKPLAFPFDKPETDTSTIRLVCLFSVRFKQTSEANLLACVFSSKLLESNAHNLILIDSLLLEMAQQQTTKRRLLYGILKFLDEEIRAEAANGERRESMEGRWNTCESRDFNKRLLSFSCCSMLGDSLWGFISPCTKWSSLRFRRRSFATCLQHCRYQHGICICSFDRISIVVGRNGTTGMISLIRSNAISTLHF